MDKRMGVKGAVLMLAVLGLVSLSVAVIAGDQAAHPDLSEQEMFQACSDCHKETTPEVQKEWFNSVHGIAMVKCYQCHGTFETFTVTPTVQNCGTCHTNMMNKKHTEGKLCWECHAPHSFKAKK